MTETSSLLSKPLPKPRSGEMFMEKAVNKNPSLRQERNVRVTQKWAPQEIQIPIFL
jgi:hypothetical protein